MLKFLENKKDRWIAFGIILLSVYCIVSRYSFNIKEFLLKVSPFQITYYSIPEAYGVLMVSMGIVGVVWAIINSLKDKSIKNGIRPLVMGIGASLIIFVVYQLNCRLILNIPSQVELSEVWIRKGQDKISLKEESLQKQLETLVLSIESLPNHEQEYLREKYRELEIDNITIINIMYPEKYGTTLRMRLNIGEGFIYIQNGHSEKERTFCKDNGISEIVRKSLFDKSETTIMTDVEYKEILEYSNTTKQDLDAEVCQYTTKEIIDREIKATYISKLKEDKRYVITYEPYVPLKCVAMISAESGNGPVKIETIDELVDRLEKSDVDFYLPTYMPEGFELKNIEMNYYSSYSDYNLSAAPIRKEQLDLKEGATVKVYKMQEDYKNNVGHVYLQDSDGKNIIDYSFGLSESSGYDNDQNNNQFMKEEFEQEELIKVANNIYKAN